MHAVYKNVVTRDVHALKRRGCRLNLIHITLSFPVYGFDQGGFGRNNPTVFLPEYPEDRSSVNWKRLFTIASS
jgi:hypothetical protein